MDPNSTLWGSLERQRGFRMDIVQETLKWVNYESEIVKETVNLGRVDLGWVESNPQPITTTEG